MENSDEGTEKDEEETAASTRFFMFLFLGFSLVLAGMAITFVASMLYGAGSANFGAVIFIGPIPIVIGAGSEPALTALFSIIIAVLSVIVFIMLRRRNSSVDG